MKLTSKLLSVVLVFALCLCCVCPVSAADVNSSGIELPPIEITHTPVKDPAVPATCTEPGKTEGSHCSGCGEILVAQQEIAALGHDWDEGTVSKEPTETEEGVKTFACSRCDETKTEAIPPLSHEHSYEATVTPPTCTEQGYTTHTCSCGNSYKDTYVDALGHDWDEGTVTKEPTATEEGEKTFACSRCDETKTEPIAKLSNPTSEYIDVPENKWYYSAVDFVINRGLMGSTKTDVKTFEPDTKVSRAMVAQILYAIAGNGEQVEYKATFTDVPSNKWYTNAVEWCAKNKLAAGSNGKFNPDGYVTRQELAVFLCSLSDFMGFDVTARADLSTFPDGAKVPTWAREKMSWAVASKLISGKGQADGTTLLDPTGQASRAELAAILTSFTKNILEK